MVTSFGIPMAQRDIVKNNLQEVILEDVKRIYMDLLQELSLEGVKWIHMDLHRNFLLNFSTPCI